MRSGGVTHAVNFALGFTMVGTAPKRRWAIVSRLTAAFFGAPPFPSFSSASRTLLNSCSGAAFDLRVSHRSFPAPDDGRADHHPREPFVVGRHHMPRRSRGRGVADHVLIRRLVLVPQRPLGDVGHGKFPVLRGLLQPVEKALALFLLRHVKEELHDHGAVARKILLERGDVLKTLAPDVSSSPARGGIFCLARISGCTRTTRHLLVVGAVEDADAAALGQRDGAAPHEIVIEFSRRVGALNEHLAALRVDAVEHALDGGVLAGGVHALKDQQQRPVVLRVELS